MDSGRSWIRDKIPQRHARSHHRSLLLCHCTHNSHIWSVVLWFRMACPKEPGHPLLTLLFNIHLFCLLAPSDHLEAYAFASRPHQQVLKVYAPSYETHGRMWPHMYNRITASLVLYQLTMLGYFGAKKFVYGGLLTPLPILTLLFVYFCTTKYYRFFQSTALDVACRELKETPNLEGVFRSYIPPSLSSDKADEDQFEDALSQVSRTGSMA